MEMCGLTLIDTEQNVRIRAQRNSRNVLAVLEGECVGFVAVHKFSKIVATFPTDLLDEVKDRDAVAHGTEDRVAVGREDDISLAIHSSTQVGELGHVV